MRLPDAQDRANDTHRQPVAGQRYIFTHTPDARKTAVS